MDIPRTVSKGMRDGHLLTIEQVATAMRVSRDTVEGLIHYGDLAAADISPRAKHVHHRPLWRIRERDLDMFLNARTPLTVSTVAPRRKNSDAVLEFIK